MPTAESTGERKRQPQTFSVSAFRAVTDGPAVSGPFSTRAVAEAAAIAMLARPDILKVVIEEDA